MSIATHSDGSHSTPSVLAAPLRALRRTLLPMLASAALCWSPSSAAGQVDSASAALPADSMTAYARAYLAIAEAQIEYQFALAEVGNKTAEAQTRIKTEARERIAAILSEHGFTADSYGRWTFLVATDADQKFQFDRRISALTGTPMIEGPIAPSR